MYGSWPSWDGASSLGFEIGLFSRCRLVKLSFAVANFQIVRELGKRPDGFVADVVFQSFDVSLLRLLRNFEQG